jgi:hypothetical protein
MSKLSNAWLQSVFLNLFFKVRFLQISLELFKKLSIQQIQEYDATYKRKVFEIAVRLSDLIDIKIVSGTWSLKRFFTDSTKPTYFLMLYLSSGGSMCSAKAFPIILTFHTV